jgi:NAD(P)-dependent dehydrogenase (short-subunit alcohol dehydrogenase family)
MKERAWGRIINIGSVAAGTGLPDVCHYGGSKAAITNLTVSLSRALAQTGITVNTVSPGLIRTPALDALFEWLGKENNWGETFEEVERHAVSELFAQSSSFVGSASDIAAEVCLLASQHGKYITGANVRVDGGMSHHPNY